MLEKRLKKAAKRISRGPLNAKLSEFIRTIPKDSRILNIGSGGEITKVIRENVSPSVQIISTDIDPDRSPDVVDDITNTAFNENSFDYVICSEVLEHVKEPFRAVENIRRILRTGGRAFVSTPFQFPIHDAPHDYFRYTEYGLALLFDRFSEVDIAPKGSWLSSIILVILRSLWFGERKQKISVYILIIWLSPALFILKRFVGNIEDRNLCSGYVCIVKK